MIQLMGHRIYGYFVGKPSFLISNENDGNTNLCLSEECLMNMIMKSLRKYILNHLYVTGFFEM